MEDIRLASLIDVYVAGVLTADELVELYEKLASSASAREQFDRQIAGFAVTHPDLALPDAAEFLAQWNIPEEAESEEVVQESTREVVDYLRLDAATLFRASFRKWRQWSIGGTVAALLVVSTLLVARHWSERVPLFQPPASGSAETVATLRHAADVQWGEITNEVFLGHAFGAERLRIMAGAVQLDFKRGARLVLEGPADLQLISDNEAFLHSGKVTAHVPDEARGFKVTAPAVAVTDLGTEFGLRADTNAPAELHVFSGIVEMQQATTQVRRMTQGQAARIRGKRIRDVSADRNAFLFEDKVIELETEEHHARYRNWRNAAQNLGSDPSALIFFTFEDQSDNARQLANRVAARNSLDPGIIAGCQCSAGRWPEKRALTFGSKADRIRFTVPNTLTSLTYMAWLRIDTLVNLSNALAITESMQQGEVHWQIYRDGRVALSAHSGSGATVDQSWDRGLSPAVFTAERLGKWTHLVSVYDSRARAINHYVNGEFISSTPIKRPLPLKLGAVEIGNWGVRVDEPAWASLKNAGSSYLRRDWKGCIDEFALLARAMSADEIRRYYEQGRVATGTALVRK